MPFYDSKDRVDGWDHFDRVSTTNLKFTFLPRRCYISGKYIWLKHAYRKTATYTGPGEPVHEHRWYDKKEFLVARLKGIL